MFVMKNETIEIIPDSNEPALTHSNKQVTHLDGVVIGVLMGFSKKGLPLVAFPGNQSDKGIWYIGENGTILNMRSDVSQAQGKAVIRELSDNKLVLVIKISDQYHQLLYLEKLYR